jgi:hypothetical protein
MRTIILLFISLDVLAQAEPVLVFRTAQKINFDGKLNDDVWQSATRFPLIRQSPDYGKNPSEKTDFRMMFDDQYVYIGSQNFVSESSRILEFGKLRDGIGPVDWISVAFDGYNDHTNALVFATTPAGNRWDGTLLVNSNGISISSNWNTYWEVKTTRDQNGWYAEFRIPISSLRFKPVNGEALMHLLIWRKITFYNEMNVFPNVPPNWGGMSWANISQGYPILFKGIKTQNPVYLTTYALAGIANDKVLTNNTYADVVSHKLNIGLDVKYALSPQVTLDATVNTDFAQAEVDNFQVNLSRSSLYFPEKRDFFLEKTNNFSFNFEGNNDAFYSRRIGLEDGAIARIYGGLRLSGRVKKTDIGLMSMQTEDHSLNATKNVSLLRVKRQVGKRSSYFGGIASSSIGKNNSRYFTYGLDNQISLPKNNFLKIALAKTESPGETNKLISSQNLRSNIRIEKITEQRWFYSAGHSIVGAQYDPALGFEERGNTIIYNTRLGYGIVPKGSKNVFRHVFTAKYVRYDGFTSKDKESVLCSFNYLAEFKNGALLNFNSYYREEILGSDLPLNSKLTIGHGTYNFGGAILNFSTPTTRATILKSTLNAGKFYDGTLVSADLNLSWDSRLVTVYLDYHFDNIEFADKQKFRNHILALSSLFSFTTQHSLSALAQYNDFDRKIGTNIRYRFNAKEGNDLYIVLTNLYNTDRHREALSMPTIQSYQLIVKYRHTFTIKSNK